MQLHCELDAAGVLVEGGNTGKSGAESLAAKRCLAQAGGFQDRVRIIQVGVIEEVEDLRANLEPGALTQSGDREAAAEGKIHVPETRAAEGVALRVADPAGRWRVKLGFFQENHPSGNPTSFWQKCFSRILPLKIGAIAHQYF